MVIADVLGLAIIAASQPQAPDAPAQSQQVTTANFTRAESDNYFATFVKDGGFGKLKHNREMADVNNQTVVRLNRDTLYSFGVLTWMRVPLPSTCRIQKAVSCRCC